jgi:hypothetical protein
MATDPQQPQSDADRVNELAARVDLVGAAIAKHEDTLAELRELVKGLAPDNAGPGYTPIPTRRWHDDLAGQERADAIERLQDWVCCVYEPVYGHLAAGLGPCWPEHPLALVVLDHMSETWGVLYARPARTQRILSAQLEFLLRYVPAAAEMLRAETRGCVRHMRRRAAP